jgi:hypothetical protein
VAPVAGLGDAGVPGSDGVVGGVVGGVVTADTTTESKVEVLRRVTSALVTTRPALASPDTIVDPTIDHD